MRQLFLPAFFSVSVLYSCSAPATGEKVSYNELNSNYSYHKKRVAVDGYLLWDEGDIWQKMGRKELVTVSLSEKPGGEGESVSFTTYLGISKNEISINNGGQATYTPEDVVIHLSDGKDVKIGQKIRVSGDANYLDTTKFQPFRTKDLVKYSFNLENVKIESAE